MSDDTLSQLVSDTIAHNLRPLLWAGWSAVLGIIVGTAMVVNTVNEVKAGIYEAKRNASEAQSTADRAIQNATDLRATVIGHDRDIAVLKSQR
jgi:hypothetical protein